MLKPRSRWTTLLFFILSVQSVGRAYGVDIDALMQHYRHLHQNPELSLQERETSEYLSRDLADRGYAVTKQVGGYGVVAVLMNGTGPVIMFRADMDALPVEERTGLAFSSAVTATNSAGEDVAVMHACGHDVHMTVLLGLAEEMQRTKRDWSGTLLLVAQPAEEIGAGSRAMIADGLYQRFPIPNYNLAFHVSPDLPAGNVGYRSGYAMANVDSVDISVYGVGGHGAYPQKTKDPVVMAAQLILALQTIVSRELMPIDSAVISVGSVHGGIKHNIIPDEVTLQLTVRSYSDQTRAFILRRIKELSTGIARTAGVPENRLPRVTVKDQYTPAVYNSPDLTERIVPILSRLLGDEAVNAVDPVMAGEDFSRYGQNEHKIPSTLLWLGAVNPQQFRAARDRGIELPGLHSALFAPDARLTIETGIRAMSAILLKLFAQ